MHNYYYHQIETSLKRQSKFFMDTKLLSGRTKLQSNIFIFFHYKIILLYMDKM